MGLLILGSGLDHSEILRRGDTDLITRNLVDLHLVESGDDAFPGGVVQGLDDYYGAGQLGVVTNLLGSFLELLFGNLLVTPLSFCSSTWRRTSSLRLWRI